MKGWIKLHRKMLDNPVICKDSDYLAVWVYMLLKATHDKRPALFGSEKIELQPGQFISGRKAISDDLNVSESKVNRIIKKLKIEQQIEQQTNNKGSLFTILNWDLYQDDEQLSEQQANNKRTASEQQVNTKQECKNVRMKENNKKTYSAFFEKIWNLYPNKKGKGQISDSQKKKLEELEFDELSRAIERYKKDLEKDSWRKPQNGSTFFNSGYVDYLDENYAEYVPDKKEKTPPKNKFNNFEGRKYDFGQLERQFMQEANGSKEGI